MPKKIKYDQWLALCINNELVSGIKFRTLYRIEYLDRSMITISSFITGRVVGSYYKSRFKIIPNSEMSKILYG